MYIFENHATYVKWKDRETDDPYEIFDRKVHDKLRSVIVPPLKIYVKSQEIDSDDPNEGKVMATMIHIYEKRNRGISYYYQTVRTDIYLPIPNGHVLVANQAVKDFKQYIVDKYIRDDEA